MTIEETNVDTQEETMPSEIEDNEDVEAAEDSVDENQEVDYTQANTDFLGRFETKYNGESRKFESVDELREYAERGLNYDKVKSQRDSLSNNPLYKYIDNYMKESGYNDPQEFVNAMETNKLQQHYIEKGMTPEDALEEAKSIVDSRSNSTSDIKQKEINNLLEWHAKMKDSGVFSDDLDVNNIPDHVVKAMENGMNAREAYMEHYLKDMKVRTEQETINKIVKNKETSGGEIVNGKKNSNHDMTPAQVNKLLDGMSESQQQAWADKNWDMLERIGYFN